MQDGFIVVGVSKAYPAPDWNGKRGAKKRLYVYGYLPDGRLRKFRVSILEAIKYRRLIQPVRTRKCLCGWKSRVAGKQDINCPSCGVIVPFIAKTNG